jgi:hypothetical protein
VAALGVSRTWQRDVRRHRRHFRHHPREPERSTEEGTRWSGRTSQNIFFQPQFSVVSVFSDDFLPLSPGATYAEKEHMTCQKLQEVPGQKRVIDAGYMHRDDAVTHQSKEESERNGGRNNRFPILSTIAGLTHNINVSPRKRLVWEYLLPHLRVRKVSGCCGTKEVSISDQLLTRADVSLTCVS